ncbi:50S ribosomal protein L29 [Candidatus Shapirobacteria bacterium CG10_big_fil_rev_8_21_14_0_10_38_14]|uniref:Large ribosomal subunit protein uL29 n=1 Tax=Candidatus Shapirobacteria bacterium CG10_big_fil_rev_8_21_14_0_10_38_14 TaxID=1974483 RepID=A0A2M8L5P5_9BACT|nr:MAG: 50S ribosomal protein L29 [Candidatus Shapirobacteria bacterium CG10_big_fil_rev_8_21_14_0_10_38_14]
MKKKEIAQLRTKDKKELSGLIQKTQGELVKLQIEFQAGKLKNINQLILKRRDLARMKTILKEKELDETV